MPEEKGKPDGLKTKIKTFSIYGSAFLILLAVLGGTGKVVVWAWGAAQKVEAISNLPEWLQRVEEQGKENGRRLKIVEPQVQENGEGVKAIENKVDQIYQELLKHRGRMDHQ